MVSPAFDAAPSDAEERLYLGEILFRQGKLREAEASLRTVTSVWNESMSEGLHLLGEVRASQERYDESLDCFERAAELKPDRRKHARRVRELKKLVRRDGRVWAWLFGNPAASEPPAQPTDWCLVGNVVQEHAFGEARQIRRGSRHFTPGTKVYCLPPQWGDGYEKVIAVGIARGSRRWITVVMSAELITDWRAKVVYKPAVMWRLREGFNGFNRQWKSQTEVESFAEWMRQRGKSG